MAADYVDYTYDAAGQLKTASGKESGGATNRMAEQFGYAYDAGGNLQSRTNNALVQSFGVDNVNQLTNVTRGGTLTVAGGTSATATNVTVKDNGNSAVAATLYADKTFARTNVTLLDGNNTFTAVATDAYGRGDTNAVTVNLPASVSYTYDDNGNLVSDGQQSYEYDGENQLVAVQVAASWRSEFRYDGKLRRRVRVEKVWQNSQWATASETRYIYDGMLVIQERDASNLPAVSYTRGRDLSGTREGAGGIGGLLARTDNRLLVTGDPSAHACYHADGNGNITALATSTQGIVARYLYDPYGNLLAKAGSLADANLYRFSSKELHPSSSLYYYGYRYYAPNLQRWASRDPVGIRGDLNLYRCHDNSPINVIDFLGLKVVIDPSAPAEFKDRIEQCLCLLKTSKRGRWLFDKADKHPRTVTLKANPAGAMMGGDPLNDKDPTTPVVIGLNPDETNCLGPANRGFPDEEMPNTLAGCAVTLAHELGHALGAEDEGHKGRNVQRNENPVRKDLGIRCRKSYKGYPVKGTW